MTTLDERYCQHYIPLVQDFLREVAPLPHPDIDRMPEPHLPLFGRNYESSALRLVIVGQDTYGWGDLRRFIATETAEPGRRLRDMLADFRTHPFTAWGNKRQTFWGFAMMFLTALHGRENWGLMKQGKMKEVLDSFAWAEGNAIELYGSSAAGKGVPADYWTAIRAAGERFNRFSHLADTIRPRIALILYRGLDVRSYFAGCEYEEVHRDGRLAHYRVPSCDADIIHVPHPGSMNRDEGAADFIQRIQAIFHQHRLTVPFPKFLAAQEEGSEVLPYLQNQLPDIGNDCDKYEFIARVADELAKREVFMSVPMLAELVNRKGGRTDYGTEFEGERGTYRLVSGTYDRMITAQRPDRAHHVAVSFLKPNFEYAYGDD